jgi:hypothetical protein
MDNETHPSMRLHRYGGRPLCAHEPTTRETNKPIRMPENCQAVNRLSTYATYVLPAAGQPTRLPLAFSEKMDRVTILPIYYLRKGMMDMTSMRAFSKRSLVFMLVLGMMAMGAAAAGFHFGYQWISKDTLSLATPETTAADLAARIVEVQHTYFIRLAACMGGLLAVCGLVAWIVLRGMARRLFVRSGETAPVKTKAAAGSDEELKSQQTRQQRLYLHLLSVLQRQGRLVDFLFEDLEGYEDAQIGAAVRGIHESCQKVVAKNLSLAAVIDGAEGQEVTVEKGFDPAAVKLTGNVTGEPPFKGILRHRGWRTDKVELPLLSDTQDAAVIAPAEVEIP